MKVLISKAQKIQPLLPSQIIVNNIEINENKRIANKFNNFFINSGPELAKEIPGPSRYFESYVSKSNSTMSTGPISANELKNVFLSIKTKKYPGQDEINFHVIRSCFGEFLEPF